MYVRTISRKNKGGSTTTYVQLAHNVRDPQTGQPRADVLYSFGRVDTLDVDAIRRLTKNLSRFLSPEEALQIQGRQMVVRRFALSGVIPWVARISCVSFGNSWGYLKLFLSALRIGRLRLRWSGQRLPWWPIAPWPQIPKEALRSGSGKTWPWGIPITYYCRRQDFRRMSVPNLF